MLHRRYLSAAWVAALLAVLLFSHATVRATAMQAASAVSPASGPGDCGAMGGMARAARMDGSQDRAAATRKAVLCPFCADAGQAAILVFAPPVLSTGAVSRVETPVLMKGGVSSLHRLRARVRDPPATPEI